MNALLPSEALTRVWPRNIPKRVNWSEHRQKELIAFVKCQMEEELLNCKICTEQQRNYGKKESVNKVMNGGMAQVKGYGIDLMKQHPGITYHTFVVVQVGFPIIVREVSLWE